MSRLVNGRATPKIIGGILLAIVGLVVVGNFARTSFGFGGSPRWSRSCRGLPHLAQRPDRPLVAPRPGLRAAAAAPYSAPPAPGAYGQTTGTAYAAPPPSRPDRVRRRRTRRYAAAPPPTPPPPPRARRWGASPSAWRCRRRCCWSLNLATTHDVPAEVVLAVCLGRGRARARRRRVRRPGPRADRLGAVLVIATSIAGISHVGLRGGVGDRTWAPRTVAASTTPTGSASVRPSWT